MHAPGAGRAAECAAKHRLKKSAAMEPALRRRSHQLLPHSNLPEGRRMNIESPAMPYNFSDLEPAMSRDTLVFHFLRHQRVCYDRMAGSGPRTRSSRAVAGGAHPCHRAQSGPARAVSLGRGSVEPQSLLALDAIPRGGGSAHGLVARADSRALWLASSASCASSGKPPGAHFGSGWLWLVWRDDTLRS